MSLLDLRIAFVSQLKQRRRERDRETERSTFRPLSDNEIKAEKEQ